MEFHLQSLQQIMINLGLSYPQVLSLYDKCGDLGYGIHTLKEASLILHKEETCWYAVI